MFMLWQSSATLTGSKPFRQKSSSARQRAQSLSKLRGRPLPWCVPSSVLSVLAAPDLLIPDPCLLMVCAVSGRPVACAPVRLRLVRCSTCPPAAHYSKVLQRPRFKELPAHQAGPLPRFWPCRCQCRGRRLSWQGNSGKLLAIFCYVSGFNVLMPFLRFN